MNKQTTSPTDNRLRRLWNHKWFRAAAYVATAAVVVAGGVAFGGEILNRFLKDPALLLAAAALVGACGFNNLDTFLDLFVGKTNESAQNVVAIEDHSRRGGPARPKDVYSKTAEADEALLCG